MKGYSKLTRLQVVKIHAAMLPVLTKQPDGTWLYADGWSDTRIAGDCIPDFPGGAPSTVGNLRLELFGVLTKALPAPPKPKGADARVDKLEAALRVLLGRLGVTPGDVGLEEEAVG